MSFLYIVTIPCGVRLQTSGTVYELNDTINPNMGRQSHSSKPMFGMQGSMTSCIKEENEDSSLYDEVVIDVPVIQTTINVDSDVDSVTTGGRPSMIEVERQMQGLFTPSVKSDLAEDAPPSTEETKKKAVRMASEVLRQQEESSRQKRKNSGFEVDVSELLNDVLNDLKITATWVQGLKGKKYIAQFPCDANKVEHVMEKLLSIGVGGDYGTVQVIPIELSRPFAAVVEDDNSRKGGKFMESVRSRLVMEKVLAQVEAGAAMTFDYLSLVVIAGFVAGMGLATNSVVAVVASMLISPIMGPILAFTFGSIILDWKMVRHGFLMECVSLLMCVVTGFIIGLVFCTLGYDSWGWPTNEMSSRGTWQACLVSITIAIPSGAGVALSILGNNTSSLVGVAISASLLPPAVNAGILWAYAIVGPFLANPANPVDGAEMALLGAWSFLLTVINIVCIYLMGLLMFKIKEVAPIPGKTDFWKSAVQAQRSANETVKGEAAEDLARDFRAMIEPLRRYSHAHNKMDAVAPESKNTLTVVKSMGISNSMPVGLAPQSAQSAAREMHGLSIGELMAYRPSNTRLNMPTYDPNMGSSLLTGESLVRRQ
ncbi:hypothetical protein SARC_03105, partial [Sphaeroforma arctica JP610]